MSTTMIFRCHTTIEDFDAGRGQLIEQAKELGYEMLSLPISTDEALKHVDQSLATFLGSVSGGERKFYVHHRCVYVGLLDFQVKSDYVETTVPLALTGDPANEYEHFLCQSAMEFFKLITRKLNCFSASLMIVLNYDSRMIAWFQGSADDLRFHFKLEPRIDNEAHLFATWLRDSSAELRSDTGRNYRSFWTNEMLNEAGMKISPELPIVFDQGLECFKLRLPSGGFALIGNNLVNGELIPIIEAVRQVFYEVDEEDRESANQTALRLHSVEDIESRFGVPDFELPATRWVYGGDQAGGPVIRQMGYCCLSLSHVTLFRVWKNWEVEDPESKAVTILLLGKEKARS